MVEFAELHTIEEKNGSKTKREEATSLSQVEYQEG
jgi:hypothetical protein